MNENIDEEVDKGPLIDTLASFARTALSDPQGLSDDRLPDMPTGTQVVDYAIDRLDDIINVLNPADETAENLAASVEMLGRHLADRADVLRSIENDERCAEAATDLLNALDLIDSALVALREEAS